MRSPLTSSVRDHPALPVVLVLATLGFSLIINLCGLIRGISIVVPHLFYIPVILAAFYFRRWGIAFAACVSAAYLLMVWLVHPGYSPDILAAAARCLVFIMIAAVVSGLSGRISLREIELLRAKDDWERTFDAVPDLVALIDRNHRILRVNRAMAESLGISKEQAVGMRCFEVVHHAVHPPLHCPHEMLLSDGNEHTEEIHEDRLGGDFLVTASPLHDAEGNVIGSVHSARDITQRRQVERVLRQSEEILQQKSQVLALRNRELNCLYEVARLVETTDSTDALLTAVAGILPSAWPYPDSTCARVVLNNREFSSADFRECDRVRNAPIVVRGKNVGRIEIFFTGDNTDTLPFPAGETDLLLTIAERLGRVLERKETEKALQESEEKYRTLVESSFDGIAIHQDGILVYVNRTAARLLGAEDPAVFIGKPAIDVVAPDFRKRIEGRVKQAPEKSLELVREQFLRLDGTPIDVDVTTAPSLWKGRPAAYVTFRDITDRVRAENALRESEEKILLLLNSAAEGIYGIDLDGDCTFCNNACLSLLGYRRQEDLLAKNMHWQIHGKHADGSPFPVEECRIFRAFRKGVGTHVDDEVLWRADGSSFPAEYWSYPQYRYGKVIGAVVTFLDITDRKRAENALRESEEKYRAIIEGMQDIFYRTDLAGKITMLSPSAARLAGYDSLDQLLGRDVTSVYADPADRDRLLAALRETGSVYAYPMDLRVRDGSIRHVTTSSHFYRDPHGNIAGVEGVIHNITELRKAEDALRESEEKFRALVETTSDFVWEVDATGHYTYVSPQVRNLLGYGPEELVGKTAFDLMTPDEARRIRGESQQLVAQHLPVSSLENRCTHKDGHIVVLETSGVPRFEKDGSFAGYRGIDRDITLRKEAEQALRESEERYRTIIENLQDVFFRVDGENRIDMVSPSAVKSFGYASAGEMLGMPVVRLWKNPDQRHRFIEALENQGGFVKDWEAEFIKKDGSVFWVSISASMRRNSRGGYAGTEGFIRDISERKKMEEALKIALRKLNMLSSITRHDILNQITGLRTFLELSREDLRGTQHEEFIMKEDQAAEAIQRQIEFTKYYQDIGVNAPKWQDVRSVIREATEQLNLKGIDVEINVPVVGIFADPLIVKVFFNLMENSLRHGERVTKMDFSGNESERGFTLIYRDNGVGVAAEDKTKLFRRGFGKHTGLGLYLSQEILAITGIIITENGTPGEGVRFEITVPKGGFRFSDNSS